MGIDLLWDFQYHPLGGEALQYDIGLGPYSFLGSPFEIGLAAEFALEYRFGGISAQPYRNWPRLFLCRATGLARIVLNNL